MIQENAFKTSSMKLRPFCLGLDMLLHVANTYIYPCNQYANAISFSKFNDFAIVFILTNFMNF